MNNEEDDEQPPFLNKSKKKRGRPRLPNKWSRIISVEDDDFENLQVWPIHDDLEGLEELKLTLIPRKKRDWQPLFTSEGFFTSQDKPQLEDYVLKDRKLRMLG